jgi:hypothetical protein
MSISLAEITSSIEDFAESPVGQRETPYAPAQLTRKSPQIITADKLCRRSETGDDRLVDSQFSAMHCGITTAESYAPAARRLNQFFMDEVSSLCNESL